MRFTKCSISKQVRHGWPLLTLCLLPGCDRTVASLAPTARAVCEAAEVCEPVVEGPELIDVLLKLHSPVTTPDHLGITLDHILPRMARRPKSHLRLWATTEREGELKLVQEVRSPEAQPERKRGAKPDRERWIAETRAAFMRQAMPTLENRPAGHGSLAAAIARVALQDTGERFFRQLVVLADGSDGALGTFACDTVAVSEETNGGLPLRRWLSDGVLSHIYLHLTYFRPVGFEGCPESALRFDILQGIWGRTLLAANAEGALIEGGPVHFTDEPFAFMHRNGWKKWERSEESR